MSRIAQTCEYHGDYAVDEEADDLSCPKCRPTVVPSVVRRLLTSPEPQGGEILVEVWLENQLVPIVRVAHRRQPQHSFGRPWPQVRNEDGDPLIIIQPPTPEE